MSLGPSRATGTITVESEGGPPPGGTPGGFDIAQLLNSMMPLMVLAMMVMLTSSLMRAPKKRTFGSPETRTFGSPGTQTFGRR